MVGTPSGYRCFTTASYSASTHALSIPAGTRDGEGVGPGPELGVDLREQTSVHRSDWPSFDAALVVEETVTLVVQVNGKVRDKVEVAADLSEADALAAARASAGAQRALQGREVAKEIVRAPKLVNFVVKG